jgi:hypothetical protein
MSAVKRQPLLKVAGRARPANPMPSAPYNPASALSYGRFVNAAYEMYTSAPKNLTPAQPQNFPTGYELTAWVNMQDSILDSTAPVFYGFIAHSLANPTQAILAIRGTSNGVEWWDDANSLGMTPFPIANCGNVALGFERIYATLEVVERPAVGAVAPMAQSLKRVGSFSAQVAAHLRRRAAAVSAKAAGSPSNVSIEVSGHSLGAALATYYATENALVHKIPNPALCTFASPKVGDQTFVNAFNNLGLTSWRVVNKQDIVPYLPPGLFFEHVNTEQLYDSDNLVQPSLGCWHSLATYLHLIDATFPLEITCVLAQSAAHRRSRF